MYSCSGRTALVTDASSGTGRSGAIALAKAGAQVLVHHDPKSGGARAVVEKIRTTGGKAQAIAADISAAEGPCDLARRAREIIGERLDILVVNARRTKTMSIENATVAEFDAKHAANVRAPFFLIQQLLPILSHSSSIIFTAAAAAPQRHVEFASTQAAVASLVGHFAPLLSPRGIRVNAIVPARLHRIGAALVFLASNQALQITGEMIQLEGSRSVKTWT